MPNDILFHWEDSPALKHHCGFCDRPLSHPGARSSCFGTHAEPCHRFHQAMFMRNRAHCCASCIGTDEAHHKRHTEIAERLRAIYISCEEDWPIIPSTEPERGRARTRGDENEDEVDRSSTSGNEPTTRKERKEAKRLIRAASRPKVITQEEIRYIDSVIHPEVSANGDVEGPSNVEQVEEIEKNLRYNAQVYNTGEKRRVIKEFSRIPDAEVDFDAEMERILDILRIAELVKRNTNTRGLQGKDLKNFEGLVAVFKERVVDDLVLVKKDQMEVRMRRAAYLRYTNRASFDIVEERYTDKDWKTGEKIISTQPERGPEWIGGSGTTTPGEADEPVGRISNVEKEKENMAPTTPLADRRHLMVGHKRVRSDGKLEEVRVVRRSPTRIPKRSPTKPPPALRLVIESKPSFKPPSKGWQMAGRSRIPVKSPPRSKYPLLSHGMRHPSLEEVLGKDSVTDDDTERATTETLSGRSSSAGSTDIPGGQSRKAGPVSRAWDENSKISLNKATKFKNGAPLKIAGISNTYSSFPRLQIAQQNKIGLDRGKAKAKMTEKSNGQVPTILSLQPEHPAAMGHLPVSQKKAKKKEREAKRKARKAAEKESAYSSNVSDHQDETEASPSMESEGTSDSSAPQITKNEENSVGAPLRVAKDFSTSEYGFELSHDDVFIISRVAKRACKPHAGNMSHIGVYTPVNVKAIPVEVPFLALPPLPPNTKFVKPTPVLPQVTTHGRHSDWTKFTRYFVVDSLSEPTIQTGHMCFFGNSCRFEQTNTPDCPYHPPHCGCADPLLDKCYLAYPSKSTFSCGPYNRIRGEMTLRDYESHDATRGKLLLVDDDIFNWLIIDPALRPISVDLKGPHPNMPGRLAAEYSDYNAGCAKGPLMQQEDLFDELAAKNRRSKHPLTRTVLRQIQKSFDKQPGRKNICYCQRAAPFEKTSDKELIECQYTGCTVRFFHRRCVKDLGVEKVSRWYCSACEQVMVIAATTALEQIDAMSMEKGVDCVSPTKEIEDEHHKREADVDDVINRAFEKAPWLRGELMARMMDPQRIDEWFERIEE